MVMLAFSALSFFLKIVLDINKLTVYIYFFKLGINHVQGVFLLYKSCLILHSGLINEADIEITRPPE